MKKAIPIFIFILLATACTPKNAGKLTLVNSGAEAVKIDVDGRAFKLLPANHISKDLSSGIHKISLNDAAPVDVKMETGRTTIFDSTGLSCYVVVDFAQRARGGNPLITEKFVEKQWFTTERPMIAVLGGNLPKKMPEKYALRLHQVDCDIVNDNGQLLKELGTLP